MDLDLIVTPGLGDNSYVLSVDGDAAVIDPQRDIDRAVDAAAARGASIRYVLETHVHNDYVSGAGELRASTGAEIVGPADAGYAFAYRPVRDGDEITLAGVRLVAMASPGHTPEHTSYLVYADGVDPVAVFSGGSLIVGGAGRTDLLGPEHVDELVRAQFATMRRFAALPDGVAVLPTHGAGSFCAAPPATDERTSVLATERATNRALATTDEPTFIEEQLRDLPAYPTYYAWMAPLNRDGPPIVGSTALPRRVAPETLADAISAGARVVDLRDGAAFAAGHIPRSLNVPLEPTFATYVGWLVPRDARILLVVDDVDALGEATTQLLRIGFDRVEGHLVGLDEWTAAGRPVASYDTVTVDMLAREIDAGSAGDLVDVRQRHEWRDGHVEGSRHLFVADVPAAAGTFPRDAVTTVVCASGFRSAMAASLLDREGVPVRLVARSGVPRLLQLLSR
jgi:glyoxylase-like metal-dependent hydrolase (beta-lactamase superfamily II)/rhodanese-related sulfurtransferase